MAPPRSCRVTRAVACSPCDVQVARHAGNSQRGLAWRVRRRDFVVSQAIVSTRVVRSASLKRVDARSRAVGAATSRTGSSVHVWRTVRNELYDTSARCLRS